MLKKMMMVAIIGAVALGAHVIKADAQDKPSGPFSVAALPYAYNALEPAIDAKTMEIHHGKHHQAYVDNLNKEVANTPALQNVSLEDIIKDVSKYSVAVRNNAGGHWNHSFFWQIMAAPDKAGAPSADLLAAINASFGSMEAFKAAFEKAGTARFGSGWVWLIVRDGQLEITSTPNQDNPLMDDAPVKGTPILANDVWEHAYYLLYQNRRGDYLKNWWSVVNWDQVSAHYAAAMAAAKK
ncbi:MAG TPA: superoxide dismutase [Micavibrio sp.]